MIKDSAIRMEFINIQTRYKEQVENIINFSEEIWNLTQNLRKEAYKKSHQDLSSDSEEIVENFRTLQESITKINDQIWQYMNMIAVNLIILFEAFNKDFLLEMYQLKPELLANNDKKYTSKQLLKFKTNRDIIHFLARNKIDLIGRRDLKWLKNRIRDITQIDISENFSEYKDLEKFYDLRNEIVHNQSILPEKFDENIQPVDADRRKISLEYNTLKKYSNVVKNYFNYILKIIVYPDKKESETK